MARKQGFLITLQAFVAVDSTDMDKMTATAAAIKAAKEQGNLSGLTGDGLTLLSFKQKYMTKDLSGALPTPARIQTDTTAAPLPIEEAIAGTSTGVYGETVETVGSDVDDPDFREVDEADENTAGDIVDDEPEPDEVQSPGIDDEPAATSGRRGARRG